MNKNLINKYYKKLKHNNIIKSNKFLDDIINKIPKSFTKNINYELQNWNINDIDQPLYIKNNFMSNTITKYIYNNINTNYNITVKYKNLSLNLNYFTDKLNLQLTYFEKIIKHILLFYIMFDAHINNINVSIYDVPYKKILSGDKIKTENINSGYSIPFSKQIVIFRIEELYKVLIHELLHIFQFEITEKNNSCGMFCDLYSIKTEPFLVNEAIVELYAIIYNSILLSLNMYNKIIKDKIIEILNIELDFNLYQTSKILVYSNFNNIEEFLCNCTNKYIMEENTNVVSYIIIKTLILFNINILHNYGNLDNRELIESIVVKFFNDTKYKKIINYYMTDIINNGMIDNNMRMSLFS